MAAEDKETNRKSSGSSNSSDSAPKAAKRAAKSGTFIGLGSLQKSSPSAPAGEATSQKDPPKEPAEGDEDDAKTIPAPPRESTPSGEPEDESARPDTPSKPGAVAKAERTSEDRARASDSGANGLAPDGSARRVITTLPDTKIAKAVAIKGTRKRERRKKRRHAQIAGASSARASEERDVKKRSASAADDTAPVSARDIPKKSSGGAILWVVLIGVVLAGGWWIFNRDATPTQTADSTASEKPESPSLQQEPAPANVESPPPVLEPAPEVPAPGPAEAAEAPPSPPSDDRGARGEMQPSAEPAPLAATPKAETPATGQQAGALQRSLRTAALVALGKNSAEARRCRRRPDPAGTAQVQVTFAASGQVSDARVIGPYAATHSGQCLVERLKQITMDPFSGDSVTVRTAIELH